MHHFISEPRKQKESRRPEREARGDLRRKRLPRPCGARNDGGDKDLKIYHGY